jgi:hypothetical protein
MFSRLVLLYFLIVVFVGSATASPIPSAFRTSAETASTSPRISCTTINDRNTCHRFDVPIIQQNASPSPHVSFSSTIIGSGSLVSEGEERQIRRIMDIKDKHKNENTEKPWMTPDIQVVLWFVLLCCLTEGIASGYQW